jgi:hypothetical protein
MGFIYWAEPGANRIRKKNEFESVYLIGRKAEAENTKLGGLNVERKRRIIQGVFELNLSWQ